MGGDKTLASVYLHMNLYVTACLFLCVSFQNDVSEENANVVDKVMSVRNRKPEVGTCVFVCLFVY